MPIVFQDHFDTDTAGQYGGFPQGWNAPAQWGPLPGLTVQNGELLGSGEYANAVHKQPIDVSPTVVMTIKLVTIAPSDYLFWVGMIDQSGYITMAAIRSYLPGTDGGITWLEAASGHWTFNFFNIDNYQQSQLPRQPPTLQNPDGTATPIPLPCWIRLRTQLDPSGQQTATAELWDHSPDGGGTPVDSTLPLNINPRGVVLPMMAWSGPYGEPGVQSVALDDWVFDVAPGAVSQGPSHIVAGRSGIGALRGA